MPGAKNTQAGPSPESEHMLHPSWSSLFWFFFFPWDILELHKNRSIVLRAGILNYQCLCFTVYAFGVLCKKSLPTSRSQRFSSDFRSDLDRVSFFVYIYDPLNVNFCIWDHTRAEVITSSLLELPWHIWQQISVCVGWFQDSTFCSMSLCVEYSTVLITVTL